MFLDDAETTIPSQEIKLKENVDDRQIQKDGKHILPGRTPRIILDDKVTTSYAWNWIGIRFCL